MKRSNGYSFDDYTPDQSGYEAVQLDGLERFVRFSLRNCDTGKHYCIKTVAKDRSLLTALYKRMGHFEGLTWRTAMETSREGGLSIEKKDTENYRTLSAEYPGFKTYGHMRVSADKKPIFRVFGAIEGDLFCILRFDVDGKMNH